MRIGNFTLWMTAREAASFGCTNHARMWGFIPGFGPAGRYLSAALGIPLGSADPVEDFLNWVGGYIAESNGWEI